MTDHYDVARVVFKSGEVAIVFMEDGNELRIMPIGMFPRVDMAEAFKEYLETECKETLKGSKLAVRIYGKIDRENAQRSPGKN